jgi:hypothetical protein
MNMSQSLGYFESNAERLKDLFPHDGSWTWDNSFSSMLTVLREEQVGGIQTNLERCLKHTCTYKQETAVNPLYRGLVSKLMGIRPEQTLHFSPCGSGLLLYAAYWPWLGSNRVSIRVGIYNPKTGRAEEGAVLDLLKTIFNMERSSQGYGLTVAA